MSGALAQIAIPRRDEATMAAKSNEVEALPRAVAPMKAACAVQKRAEFCDAQEPDPMAWMHALRNRPLVKALGPIDI